MALADVRADIIKNYGSVENYASNLVERAKAGVEKDIVQRATTELSRIGEVGKVMEIFKQAAPAPVLVPAPRTNAGKSPSQLVAEKIFYPLVGSVTMTTEEARAAWEQANGGAGLVTEGVKQTAEDVKEAVANILPDGGTLKLVLYGVVRIMGK